MHPLLVKLNFKPGMPLIVANAPPSFQGILNQFSSEAELQLSIPAGKVRFILVFAHSKDEVNSFSQRVLPKLEEDALVWFAYPKKSSKSLKTDISRDSGWESLKKAQFETVRLVAIDNDWSALRFRDSKYIKKSSGK